MTATAGESEMMAAGEVARRNPMRPPDSLPRDGRAALENYWWGVSMGLGDHVLGTAPAAESVARSDTRHDLEARF